MKRAVAGDGTRIGDGDVQPGDRALRFESPIGGTLVLASREGRCGGGERDGAPLTDWRSCRVKKKTICAKLRRRLG